MIITEHNTVYNDVAIGRLMNKLPEICNIRGRKLCNQHQSIPRQFYLYNENPYACKTVYLYRSGAQKTILGHSNMDDIVCPMLFFICIAYSQAYYSL